MKNQSVSVRFKTKFALALVSIWMCTTVYAFWWFEMRDLRPFDLQRSPLQGHLGITYEPSELKRLLTQQGIDLDNNIVVVHFWNPDCSCNRWNEKHVKQIVADYQNQGVVVVTVTQPSAGADLRELAELAQNKFTTPVVFDSQRVLTNRYAPDATPAAAVMDSGKLAYLGPYSVGAMCGSKGGAFVERTLDSLLAGKLVEMENLQSFGCFCDWSNATQA